MQKALCDAFGFGRDRLTDLTHRERQVLCTVAQGLSNAEIGRGLAMTEATVKIHVSRTLTKLGVTNGSRPRSWLTRRACLARDAAHCFCAIRPGPIAGLSGVRPAVAARHVSHIFDWLKSTVSRRRRALRCSP
jgi:DNA-binding CsgD family transcriptional regulator